VLHGGDSARTPLPTSDLTVERQKRSRRLDQPRRSALGVTHCAEYAAFKLMEELGRSEKTITARIAYDDTRLLRSDLDDVAIGQFTPTLYSPCAI
jgi:hypothetical protein